MPDEENVTTVCCTRCGSRNIMLSNDMRPSVCGDCGNQFMTPDQLLVKYAREKSTGTMTKVLLVLFFGSAATALLFTWFPAGIATLALGAFF